MSVKILMKTFLWISISYSQLSIQLEYWIYTRDLDNLHALNSRKIQISCGFDFAVLPENLWPRCVSNSRLDLIHVRTYEGVYPDVCRMANTYECTIVHLLTMYMCMYVHKKRLLYANHFFHKKPKLVTLCWTFVLVWKVVRWTCVESRFIHPFSSFKYRNSASRYISVTSVVEFCGCESTGIRF